MRNLKLTLLLFTLVMIGWSTKAQTVQVGSGDGTTYAFPIATNWVYSYTQQIYTKAEINTAGEITKIRFFYISSDATAPNFSKDWVIYMGHTSQEEFANDYAWVPLGSMIQVFDG